MDDELRSKIEEVVEEKVEESLEEDADTKFSKLVDKKIERKLREGKIEATREISSDNEMNRRSFLKILGLGSAGIGLASSAAAANLLQGTKINGNTVFHTGNDGSGSNFNADTVDGKDASQIGGNNADQVDGFDIQKNGNNTNGVINLDTNNNTITVDGDIVVGSAIPDSAIANYDATREGSTGTISTVEDRLNNFDLGGTIEVIDSGINGGLTYRLQGGNTVENSNISVSGEEFGVVYTAQHQDANNSDGHPFSSLGSHRDFAVQDDDNSMRVFRDNNLTSNDSDFDQNKQVYRVRAFNTSSASMTISGNTVLSGSPGPGGFSGLIWGARFDGTLKLDIDIAEFTILENATLSDFEQEEQRQANKYGITLA